MPLDIVLGTQWGDEGKGRIVDLLAAEADIVARYNGGDNAGHTVTAAGRVFKLHLVPSGITQPHVTVLLGGGMVINPARLLEELEALEAQGLDVSPARIKLSPAAHIITPAHLALDGAEEQRRARAELGTTRRGIGPAYSDKAARRGLRAGAMRDPQAFGKLVATQVRQATPLLQEIHHLPAPDPEQAGETYARLAARLSPYLADISAMVAEALAANQTVLAEGAQGTLLDLDLGTYPFVTSSHPTAAGALLGLGVGAQSLRRVIGVTKAFQTRVGSGPFPTELTDETADRLRGTGKNPWDEFGTTTGRPRRCGWLDGALLTYARRVNGLTELALTKLDILTGIDPVRLCCRYRPSSGPTIETPIDPVDLSQAAPEYDDLPGWIEDLQKARTWGDLPVAARGYVEHVEALAGVPVRLISVGPERGQVIHRDH